MSGATIRISEVPFRRSGTTILWGAASSGTALMVDAGGREQYPAGGPATEMNRWSSGEGGIGLDDEGRSGVAMP